MAAFSDLQLKNLQGFGIAGFRKDHQELIALRFGDPVAARRLLTWLQPRVSSAWEVGTFNEVFSEILSRTGEEVLEATWLGLLVSAAGLEALGTPSLVSTLPTGDGTAAFAAGMAARSSQIGDDIVPDDGPSTWLKPFATPGGVDLLIVVASDDVDKLADLVTVIGERASACGCDVIWQERGATLEGDLRGHEHFGFRDGGSQPAIDGYDDPPGLDEPPAVPAGEFVLGYPDASGATPITGALVDSSMVVFRRLQQNVTAFRALAAAGVPGSTPTVSADQLAAKMVGRWPSGAPIETFPDADPGAGNETNGFIYHATDDDGQRCPQWAHIRKVNPRDETTPDPAGDAPQRHRMIRRGIPYGPAAHPSATPDDGVDRGLHFFALVADVARQFEFIQRRWLDDPNFPGGQPPAPNGPYGPPPSGQPGGPDPVVGQYPPGSSCVLTQASGQHPFPLGSRPVRMTGGEYFLLPSLAAIASLATGTS